MKKKSTQQEPIVPPELAGTVNDPRGPGFVLRTLPNGQKQFGHVNSYPPPGFDPTKAGETQKGEQ